MVQFITDSPYYQDKFILVNFIKRYSPELQPQNEIEKAAKEGLENIIDTLKKAKKFCELYLKDFAIETYGIDIMRFYPEHLRRGYSPEQQEFLDKHVPFILPVVTFFCYYITHGQLNLLRTLLPSGIVTDEDWEASLQIRAKVDELKAGMRPNSSVSSIYNMDFYKDLKVASHKILDYVKDGETIIAVGNTPQYIRYVIDKEVASTGRQVTTISLAISGWPGVTKPGFAQGFLENLLTPEAHAGYLKYMHSQGLELNHTYKKIHLLDCVGQGGGLDYIIRALAEIYGQDNMPEVGIIATNKVAETIVGPTVKVPAYSLDMIALTNNLDRVNDEIRLMPHANSWRWDEKTLQAFCKHQPFQPQGLGKVLLDKIDSSITFDTGTPIDITLAAIMPEELEGLSVNEDYIQVAVASDL
jgi:hypothetical protein